MAARNSDHIAEAGDNHIGQAGEGDGPVQVSTGGDAHGAARPGKHLYILRQELAPPVFEDGRGMPAAEFHQPGRFAGTPADSVDELPGQFRVTVLVSEFHLFPSSSGMPDYLLTS